MKRYINKILGVSLIVGLFGSACMEDTRLDMSNDYNFSQIEPIISGMSGPSTVIAGGLSPTRFQVNARTGSVYTWAIIGHSAVIEAVEGYNMYADITFAQTSVAVNDVLVTVFETTSSGLVSAPDTLVVDLEPFCSWAITDFVGTWTGTESTDGGAAEAISVTIEQVDATTLVAKASSGTPGFLQSTFTGWGETFQTGFGFEGDIQMTIGLTDGTITFVTGEYWGQTLPGPYDYWYVGSGNWSGCDESIKVSFELHWDDDDFEDGGDIVSEVEIYKN